MPRKREPSERRKNRLLMVGMVVYLGSYLEFSLFSDTGLFSGWSDVIFLVATSVMTLLIVGRDFGWKRSVGAVLCVILAAGIVQMIGAKTGYPFGQFKYTDQPGLKILGSISWLLPLLWVVLLLNAYILCSVLVVSLDDDFSRDSGLLLIAITAMVVTLMDLNFEPVLSNVKQYWFWLERDWEYYGIPRQNFLGWFLISLILAGFLTFFLEPNRWKTSTAWFSFGLLASLQFLFAVVNWQTGQYVPVVIALNLTGLLAIALVYVSER